MKRIMMFTLIVCAAVSAMGAATPATADRPQAARVAVGLEDMGQEIALLGRSAIVSVQAPPCVACIAQSGACSGGAGTICNKASRCTCQWCGGSLVCRPRKGIHPIPIPIPEL